MSDRSQREKARREMLRGAFEDNIEALTGKPSGSLRGKRLKRRSWLKRTVLISSMLGLAVFSVAAWLARPEVSHSKAAVDEGGRPLVLVPVDSEALEVGEETPLERLADRLSNHKPQNLMHEVIPLEISTVAIDPGHGGRDGGTSLKFGLNEKDLTRDIADRLARRLEAASVKTVMTRNSDESVSLKERAAIANSAKADIFVSIHVNWLPNRHSRGVETYFLGTTDDPYLNSLAAAENSDSGFSMADYRQLLEGIYADVRQAESQRLATTIQHSLFETLRRKNSRIVSRGVMTAPFVVLVATEMPAILAEVACLSNDEEARLLAIPSYRQNIADALYGGILQYTDSVSRVRENQPIQIAEKGKSEHDQGNQND